MQVDPGASLDLSLAALDSDADYLLHNGNGLALGTNDFLVAADYDNANFGVHAEEIILNPLSENTGGYSGPLPSITITLKATVSADLDGSGAVDGADLNILLSDYGGRFDHDDLDALIAVFGSTGTGVSP